MSKASPSRRALLALLSVSYTVSFIDRALVSVAGAPIKADLQLTDAQFGALQGLAFALLYCLAGVPLGWIADRSHRPRLIAFGLLFWSVMTVLCGLARTYGVLFLARVGVGLGEACLLPAGISLLVSATPPGRMGRSVAVFLLGATAGNVIALLGGGVALQCLGDAPPALHGLAPWRTLFLLSAAPGLLMAGFFLRMQDPAALCPPPDRRSLSDSVRALRHDARAYGWLTAATACSLTLAQAQSAWIPQVFVRRFGLPPGESAILIGAMVLASAPLGQWIGGRMIDRFNAAACPAPAHRLLAICSALCVLPAILFCTTGSLAVAIIAYVLFNGAVFASTPAGLWGWQRLASDADRGFIIALLVSIVTLVGAGLGPLAVGLLSDHLAPEARGLGSALLSVILIAAAGCWTTALIGRRAFAGAQARPFKP